jgi:AcrR family transcriptional regulator
VKSGTKRTLRTTRAERREQMRSQLQGAVEELLAGEHRYTDLLLDRIVAVAGVSRSNFYVYFEDKSMLLQELFEGLVDELTVQARPWWELPPTASKDELRAALSKIFQAFLPHRHVWAAAVEAASYDDGMRERFGALMEDCVENVATHIRTGQAAGFVRGDRDPDTMAAWLLWMTERGLYQLVTNADADRLEALLDSFTNIYWDSLYAGRR